MATDSRQMSERGGSYANPAFEGQQQEDNFNGSSRSGDTGEQDGETGNTPSPPSATDQPPGSDDTSDEQREDNFNGSSRSGNTGEHDGETENSENTPSPPSATDQPPGSDDTSDEQREDNFNGSSRSGNTGEHDGETENSENTPSPPSATDQPPGSDDTSDEQREDNFNGSSRSGNTGEHDGETENSENTCCLRGKQFSKVMTILALLSAVLLSSMFMWGTVVFAASNIRTSSSVGQPLGNTTPTDTRVILECVDYMLPPDITTPSTATTLGSGLRLSTNGQPVQETKCLALPRGWDLSVTHTDTCLSSSDEDAMPGVTYHGEMCETADLKWAACLLLMTGSMDVLECLRWLVNWLNHMNTKTEKNILSDKLSYKKTAGITAVVAAGRFLLVFVVLPRLDNVVQMVAILLGVGVVPAFFSLKRGDKSGSCSCCSSCFGVLACLAQVGGLVILTVKVALSVGVLTSLVLPLSLVLISVAYWPNYSTKDNKDSSEAIGSLCRVVLTFVLALGFTAVQHAQLLFFPDEDEHCSDRIRPSVLPGADTDWVWVWLTNLLCVFVLDFAARIAAQIRVQITSYALPLSLAAPLTMLFLHFGVCGFWKDNPCYSTVFGIPGYVYFRCQASDGIGLVTLIAECLLHLSQLWLTLHIWQPGNKLMAPFQSLFVRLLVDGVLLPLSLLYSRNRQETSGKEYIGGDEENQDPAVQEDVKSSVPFIRACVTMWHETEEEMIRVLTSIMKLDKDQKKTKKKTKKTKKKNKSQNETKVKYNLDAHIYFDDAMEKGDINEYVSTLVRVIKKLGNTETCDQRSRRYGAQLEFKMPKGNKLYVHLKDNRKVKQKKRWSQVMYMHDLLLHQGEERENPLASDPENTLILALDGDVQFEPSSVLLMKDLLLANKDVGAVCGRIHPVGSGSWLNPIMWYQKFEYALGHWMQKSSEEVFGSVLCCPGCFSLFKGSALVAVRDTYQQQAEKAIHYLQYDQGEDRWLCTLMLKKGYRLVYCAAADAKTFAPEDFQGFFKQRRRWIPSSVANVRDVIMNWGELTRNNDHISHLFLLYQFVLLLLSSVGPGMIFLMLAGSMELVMAHLNLKMSLLINALILLTLVIICQKKPKDALLAAYAVSFIYALLQIVVLVGIIAQMVEQGWCSPTTFFFILVAGAFLLAALVHPLEVFLIIHGLTFYFAIPCMYMVLPVYALLNMDVQAWGTREKKEMEAGPSDVTDDDQLDDWANWANWAEGELPEFLKPSKESKEKDLKTAEGLEPLKWTTCQWVLGLNCGVVVLLLSLQSMNLNVPWLCGEDLYIDFVALFLLGIYVGIILLQIVGMLLHRVGTYLLIMATTPCNCYCAPADGENDVVLVGYRKTVETDGDRGHDVGNVHVGQDDSARGQSQDNYQEVSDYVTRL